MISPGICLVFASKGGSGISEWSVAIWAWMRSPRPSAWATARRPSILPLEFNRQPVALTEFSIEIGHCPRLPLVSSALAAAPPSRGTVPMNTPFRHKKRRAQASSDQPKHRRSVYPTAISGKIFDATT